jgi:hypothetical protein
MIDMMSNAFMFSFTSNVEKNALETQEMKTGFIVMTQKPTSNPFSG